MKICFLGSPSFVLDCIDDNKTKVDLLVAASERKIPLLASMGAGARADPTQICIGNLTNATGK